MERLVVNLAVRDAEFAVWVAASVRNEREARQARVTRAGQIGAERNVHAPVIGAPRRAERDIRTHPVCAGARRRRAPSLLHQSRVARVQRGRFGRHAERLHVERDEGGEAEAGCARQPACGREDLVQFAEAEQIVIGPAVRAGQTLGGRVPIEGDIGPEIVGQRVGQRAGFGRLRQSGEQQQGFEVDAVVGGADELMRALFPQRLDKQG